MGVGNYPLYRDNKEYQSTEDKEWYTPSSILINEEPEYIQDEASRCDMHGSIEEYITPPYLHGNEFEQYETQRH